MKKISKILFSCGLFWSVFIHWIYIFYYNICCLIKLFLTIAKRINWAFVLKIILILGIAINIPLTIKLSNISDEIEQFNIELLVRLSNSERWISKNDNAIIVRGIEEKHEKLNDDELGLVRQAGWELFNLKFPLADEKTINKLTEDNVTSTHSYFALPSQCAFDENKRLVDKATTGRQDKEDDLDRYFDYLIAVQIFEALCAGMLLLVEKDSLFKRKHIAIKRN